MKYFVTIIFILAAARLFGQDFTIYKDTANHFSIGIPEGWIVEPELNHQSSVLSVRLKDLSEGGIVPSFHMNIIPNKNTTLEKYYQNYCRPFDSPKEDREIIQEGDYNTNGISYKWIQTKRKTIDIRTLIYYCYNNENIYEISYAGDPPNFLKYVETLKKVIETFRL